MPLAQILNGNTIEAGLKLKNREQLLTCVAETACRDKGLDAERVPEIFKALMEREELASTAMGAGVAIPHCRIPGLESFVAGIITTRGKIPYDAPDNEKVDIFPFVIGPENNPREHLKVLSGMARLLRNPDTRKTIRSFRTSEELCSFLKKLTEDKPEEPVAQPSMGMKMLHVFVRDQELFNDILQVFASGEYSGAMVLEAHESTEYMSSMPVFAGFWNNELNTFNRIIVAAVKSELLNQTMRNIEYVCGPLKDQKDLMITVTDLHHVIGSLDF